MSHEEAEHALKQANRAAKVGDIAAAERWSKIAERLSAAHAKLAPAEAPVEDYAAAEALRAELRARIMRFVEADQEIQTWERDHAAWREAKARGEEVAPMRPHPAGPMSEEEYMTKIAMGEAVGSGQ